MKTSSSDLLANMSAAKRLLLEKRLRGEKITSSIPAPVRVPREGAVLPLSYAQQRMWFIDQLTPGRASYNIPGGMRLEGPLNLDILKQAMQEIVGRHESTRTRFAVVKGEPQQVIDEKLDLDVPVVDLGGTPEAEREAEAKHLARIFASQPFDLEHGPLFRVKILRLSERHHVMLINMHHIVSDGWSSDILLREFAQLYGALSAGRSPSLPELPVQYADYAVWQRSWLKGEILEKKLSYWKGQLAGVETADLPTDRPRPAVQGQNGEICIFTLEAGLTERLRELARSQGATLYMTLLAALQLLIYRYNRHRDVVVGAPVAGRTQSQIEGLIGLFVNTLVFRTDFSGGPSFTELLGRVKKVTLGAFAHQDVPFEKLVDALQLERDLSRSPLFQVAFAMQGGPQVFELGGMKVGPFLVESGTAKFDLTLMMGEGSTTIESWLEYNTDLFDRASAEIIMRHFQMLLHEVITTPGASIDELPLLSASERKLLQSGWNGWSEPGADSAARPGRQTICDIVSAHAERSPNAAALISDGETLSYRTLNQRADQMAARLQALAPGPGARAGICLERGADRIVAALAVLKAGMTLVPLEIDEPAERLAGIINDSAVAAVIADRRTQDRFLPFPAIQRLSLSEDAASEDAAQLPEDEKNKAPAPSIDADSPACLLYHSGPEGKPEGVLLQHRALLGPAFGPDLSFTAEDRVAQRIDFAHDAACLEVFSTLAAGACVVDLSRKPAPAPREIFALLDEEQATVLCASAAMLERIARSFPVALKDLRLVICEDDSRLAGRLWEMAKPGVLKRACAVYGAAEAAGWQMLYQPAQSSTATQQVASGKRIHLVDGRLEPAPYCIVGEILVAGDDLAIGYERQPARTAEVFLPDPFSEVPGARLYRTGDLGRRRPDGRLQLLGRHDGRTTVHGVRAERKEIEDALLRHPAVREAAVLLREMDGVRDRAMEAFVVVAEGQSVSAGELRQFLEERLPEWMLPSGSTVAPKIPRTGSGEADFRALARLLEEKKHVGPRNPIEEVLCGIWARLLNRERVGVYDNFFELGGDSILSVQVIAQARAAGLQITPRQMFERQTVAALAEVAVVMEAAEMDADETVMTGPAPMTPIQEMFFQWKLAKPQHFNQAVLLQLRPAVNSELLEKAFSALLQHHDALRMRYESGPAGWVQLCEERMPEGVYRRKDLSGVEPQQQPSALEHDAEQIQGGLDLASGRLVAAVEYDLGNSGGRRLLLVIHHLVVDGVSWRILLEDLEIGYEQLQRGQAVRLGAKTTSLKRWAEGIRQYSEKEQLRQELAYWCSDARKNVKPLPRDFDSAGEEENTVDTRQSVTVALEKEETRELLQDVPGVYHTQINDALLAALARVCREWSSASRLLVDVEGHGREDVIAHTDVSRTVGWLATIYPVALEVEGRWDPGGTLKSTKEQLRQAPNHGFGYGVLRYASADPQAIEQLAAMPQAEILFNYMGQLDQALQGTKLFLPAEESIGRASARENRRVYPLEVTASVAAGRLQVIWSYSERLHRRETIEAVARQYAECLRELIEHCRTTEAGGYTPSDFPVASLRQADLDQWIGRGEGIEDIYGLSPMQHGMLFHSLYEPGTGVYFVQMACEIRAAMNTLNFRQAWNAVVQRHRILRTGLLWEGLEEPVQVVRAQVDLPWTEEDWRGTPPDEQEQKWQSFLKEDRKRGFDLRRAPLLRLMLTRTGEESYYLAWSTHHILMDGWCLQILLAEVFRFYNALCEGRELELERPPLYREYIRWLRQQEEQKTEAFWREELKGFNAPTRLRLEEPKTALEEGQERYAEISRLLARELTEDLEELAVGHHVTLNTVLQAAWAVLLSRYSGDADVLFGAAVAGRSAPVPGIENMVGLFINTLPVRVRMEPEETIGAYLQSLQRSQTLAREFEYSPLLKVQGWSEVQRGTPLFDSLLVFENFPVDANLGGSISASLKLGAMQVTERTNYPLTLKIFPGKELLLIAVYDRRLLLPAGIEQLLRHLHLVLKQMTFGAERRVNQISLLTEPERRQVLVEWNQSAAQYPSEAGKCVHELFAAQAARSPRAMALEFESAQVTYEDLNRQANQIAHYLRALGVGPETRVAVCLERSAELVAGLIGILKAGGAYVPLDPNYPAERLKYMLEDSQATVVLTRHELLARLPEFAGTVVQLDKQREDISRQSAEEPGRISAPENLMYVAYTSGSTGTPKGVAGTHQSMVNRLAWMQNAFPLKEDEFCCQKTSLGFLDSVAEIFGPLAYGAPLLIIPENDVKDVKQLVDLLASRRVTRIVLVPSLLRAILAAEPGVGSRLAKLRTVVTSGEALPMDLANLFQSAMPHATLLNFYGSSEVAADATWSTVSGRQASEAVLIGRPMGNVRVLVLDDDLEPLPVGMAGDLYVGGAGLARGYVNRGDLTAEKFVPDPFSAAGGERLYRTGDLARWSAQGELEFLGRKDYQVKIRGYRIELGEIESALRAVPSVAQTVVVVRQLEQQESQLVAYVVAKEKTTIAALREALRRQLPEYMLPSAFVMLEAMPLTPSGKIDRRALPAPAAGREGEEASYVAPRTPVEELLAGAWADVLRVERVGVHDNFFNLGGHSLLATRVVARIASVLQVELPMRRLFENPTVAGVAQVIEQLLQGDNRAKVPPLVRRPDERVVPLSYAQQRLWFIEQLAPGGAAYNIPSAVRIRGPLDAAVLKEAIAEVIRRQSSLRTHFAIVESEARQVVDDEAKFELPVIELGAVDPKEQEAEVRRLALEDGRTPFDLGHAPLLRVKLLRLAEQHHVLLATMHHVVSDGWSMGILVQEISRVYAACIMGTPSPLPDLPIQYTDYSVWQRNWLTGEVLQRELGYWRGQLAHMQKLELPADHPRPRVQTPNGANVGLAVPVELAEKLKDLARREGVTLYMVLLAAFQTLLYRYSRQTDVTVGSPIAGRTRSETEGLIGFFVNMLVLRSDLSGTPGFVELLRRVKETTLDAYAHQDAPFEKLVDELEPERDMSRTPLFQVAFVLQNAPQPEMLLEDTRLEGLNIDNGTAKFDLSLGMGETAAGIQGVLQYNTDLFEEATAARMVQRLLVLLQDVAEDPARSIDVFPLVSAEERRRLAAGWGGEAQAIEAFGQTVGGRLREYARKHPEAIALIEDQEEISYGDLERRANQVANGLRTLGAGNGDRIGICLESGWQWIAGALGAFKTGAAFVPLEPAEPEQRLSYLLQDAGVRIVLTEDSQAERFRTLPVKLLLPQEVARQSSEDRSIQQPLDSVACLLYRSSAAGKPQAVLVPHRALCRGVTQELGLTPSDRLLQRIDFSRETGCFEIFTALAEGAGVVIAPRHPMPPRRLALLLQAHGVTALWTTASELEQLAHNFPGGLKRARFIVVEGGIGDVAGLRSTLKAEVPPVYGVFSAGETAGRGMTYALAETDVEMKAIPTGRVAAGARFYLLDQQLEPAPEDMLGEICVAGDVLATGYHRRPESSAQALAPDPFTSVPGGLLYRTGELGRRRADGRVELRGRHDRRVMIGGMRVEPQEIEAVLAGHPRVKDAAVLAQKTTGVHGPELAAFIVSADANGAGSEELRQFLRERLPEAMLPHSFTAVAAIPRNLRGEADQRALSQQREATKYAGPQNRIEEILCDIWKKLLQREQVGIHDNFFQMGGDSILSIQVITHARECGVQITPRQMFECQTIAALAEVATLAQDDSGPEETISGPVPLMPIQQAFLGWQLKKPEHFNQAVLLQVKPEVDSPLLEQALTEAIKRHDALRMKYEQHEEAWRQSCEEGIPEGAYRRKDMRGLEADQQNAELRRDTEQTQASLDLAAGRLLQAVEYDLGAKRGRRLLLVIHHLAVDGVSWRVLFEDLELCYRQLKNGEPVSLGRKTASVRKWAEATRQYCESEQVKQEVEYWCSASRREAGPLTGDYVMGKTEDNTVATLQNVTVSLEAEETRELLQQVPQVYHTQINDALLAALGRACGEWSGNSHVLIDVEGHGREEVLGMDVSRTMGWFTTIYPVLLERGAEQHWDPGRLLRATKEQLRSIPNRGFGYSVLRHVSNDQEIQRRLSEMPQSQIIFNYLGQVDQVLQGSKLFAPGQESSGRVSALENQRRYMIDVNAVVAGGQLQVSWSYSEKLHRRETIERVARRYLECLRQIIAHCRDAQAGGYSPSDFPLARLDQQEMDRSIGKGEGIEDVYSLTPMQEGMLFHSRYDSGSAVYFIQIACQVHGPLNVPAFRRAWQDVVTRHAVFRTSFRWEGLKSPVQVVHQDVTLPWHEEDWRELPEAEQERKWIAFLEEDRQRGLDYVHAPLMRMALMRAGEQNCYFSWGFGHILMDGWCVQIVMGDVFRLYEAYRQGQKLELRRPPLFRDYIAWLQQQDEKKAEKFWRAELKGFKAPTRLRTGRELNPENGKDEYQQINRLLSRDTTAALEDLARQNQVTMNTVVQGAWAVLLGRYSGDADVVFGATLAGRSASVTGIESMVGIFINTLPVRTQVRSEETVAEYLRRLQERQAAARDFEYTSLVKVQGWSDVPPATPLFENILVFENYPVDAALRQKNASAIELSGFRNFAVTNYPLSLRVFPGKELRLDLTFRTRFHDEKSAERLVEHMAVLLEQMAADPGRRVGQLSLLMENERRQFIDDWNEEEEELDTVEN